MLILYDVPVSLYCAKVRIAMRHKGLTWREDPPPGGYGSAAYRTLVPSGNLPAIDDGGLILADSEAITEYLEERYPNPPMLPDDIAGRAKARELSRFHDTRLEPELRGLFGQIAPGGRDAAVVAARTAALSARLVQLGHLLERMPGEAAGRALSLGDCGYPATARWIEAIDRLLRLGIDWPPMVRAYLDRLGDIPAVRDEMASYCPVIPRWLAAKEAG